MCPATFFVMETRRTCPLSAVPERNVQGREGVDMAKLMEDVCIQKARNLDEQRIILVGRVDASSRHDWSTLYYCTPEYSCAAGNFLPLYLLVTTRLADWRGANHDLAS